METKQPLEYARVPQAEMISRHETVGGVSYSTQQGSIAGELILCIVMAVGLVLLDFCMVRQRLSGHRWEFSTFQIALITSFAGVFVFGTVQLIRGRHVDHSVILEHDQILVNAPRNMRMFRTFAIGTVLRFDQERDLFNGKGNLVLVTRSRFASPIRLFLRVPFDELNTIQAELNARLAAMKLEIGTATGNSID